MAIFFWPSIQQVTAGISSSPAAIARDSQWTIVAATVSGGSGYVVLPSDAEIGDLVEVHNAPGNSNAPTVVVPSSNTLLGQNGPAFYRKINTSLWNGI